MKKKLTVNTLALSNLKTRKKQYALILAGIIFAMVFSSTILFFISSMYSSTEEMAKNSVGNCNSIIINADEDFIETAYNESYITEYGFAHIIGFAQGEDAEENQGAAMAYLDDSAKELSYISFVEGAYPENEGEIAIEKSALSKLGLSDAQIGDTVTFQFYNQNGSEISSEAVQKSFTLVGIALNKESNIEDDCSDTERIAYSVPSAFVYQGADTDLGGKQSLCCYFNYDDADSDSYDVFYSYLEDNGVDVGNWIYVYHDSYLFTNSDTFSSVAFAILLCVVMLIASCMGIINSFGSNLKERKKQIGILRTVGASQRQIILIYGREAFIISLVCAPVSVLISYFIVKATTYLFSENFVFIADFRVLVACAVAGVCFVMAASLVPLVSASKISPLQSIRNISATRKMKTKKIKSQETFNMSSLISKRYLVFNNSKRVIVCVFLVFTIIFSCYGFSVSDYVTGNYYTYSNDYQLYGGATYYTPFCNLKSESNGAFSENNKKDILLSPYVEEVNGSKTCTVVVETDGFSEYQKIIAELNGFSNVFTESIYDDNYEVCYDEVNKDNINETFFSEYSQSYLEIKQECAFENEFFSSSVNALDTTVLKRLESSVSEGKINIDKVNSGEEIILVAPEVIGFDVTVYDDGYGTDNDANDDYNRDKEYDLVGECDYKVGDEINISVIFSDEDVGDDYEDNYNINYERTDYTVTIGAIIYELPDGFDEYSSYDSLSFLTTINGMNVFSPDEKYNMMNVVLKEECTDEIDEDMTALLTEITDVSGGTFYSNYGGLKEQEQYAQTLSLSVIAVIILFLSISASIINNSLTSQIREGRRQMGTLRAVGASERDIIAIYIKQLLSIFARGYGIGFGGFFISYGAATLISYAYSKAENYEFTGLEMNICIWETVLACVILFAVCCFNLWLRIKKETKNSIIDNVREL